MKMKVTIEIFLPFIIDKCQTKGNKNGDLDGDTCQIKSEMEMKI